MRKVIAEIAISIDGFIEGPNGELDWIGTGNCHDEDKFLYANNFLKRFDTIFYGRVTYEKFGIARLESSSHSEAEQEFDNTLSNMRKYVFTRSIKHVPGNGMVISQNVDSEVKRIKDEEGKDIWLCGGANILTTFMSMDLIDEYILSVQPTILGSGKPFFENVTSRFNLKLLRMEKLNSGVVILNYKPVQRK